MASPPSANVRAAVGAAPAGLAALGTRMRATTSWLSLVVFAATVVVYLLVAYRGTLGEGQTAILVLVTGVVTGFVAWAAAAVLTDDSVTAPLSNPRIYSELDTRVKTLQERLKAYPAESTETATLEITKLLQLAGERLASPRIDGGWSSGTAYVDVARQIHLAEEAFVELVPEPTLRAELMQEELRIANSELNREDSKVRQRLNDIHKRLKTSGAKPDPERIKEVRAELREMRHAINEFRDRRIDAMIRARKRLTWTTILTGWAAYAVLALAILTNAEHTSVAAAVTFYLVGAGVGLFARVRADAHIDEVIEDYGLAAARLRQTELVSGTAGVLGVILAHITLGGIGLPAPPGNLLPLHEIMVVNPPNLLVAAVFGLAPRLVTDRLDAQANQYRRELASTTASDASAAPPTT